MTQPADDQWHQLWGTFSVKDHCRPGGFIPEVLIYDQLVLPVVPTAEDFESEGRARGLTTAGAKEFATKEWERWEKEGWNPARQRVVAKLLEKKGRVTLIPWTFARQIEWSSLKQVFGMARDGFLMTGNSLTRFVPAMAKAVVAVPQYNSLKELEAAERMHLLDPHGPLPAGNLLAVLGHELLLPGDPQQDDFRYLEEALDASGDPDYQQRRRSLYEWQQRFVRGDYTDARSIKAAVEEMEHLVRELQKAATREKQWTWAKRCFTIVSAGTAVAAALVDPSLAMWPAGGSAVATVGTLVIDEFAPKPKPGVPAASLVLEARSALGIA